MTEEHQIKVPEAHISLILHHPIFESGLYLAKNGRQECLASVAGLRQYSIPYPQMWGLAEEIEQVYKSTQLAQSSQAPSHVGYFPSPMSVPGQGQSSQGLTGLDGMFDGILDESKDLSTTLFEWLQQP